MPTEDSKVDATQWYAAVQRWMAEFWHMKPGAPGQPPTAGTPSRKYLALAYNPIPGS
jgi:hypothetical protein